MHIANNSMLQKTPPSPKYRPSQPIGDLRFRALLPRADWDRLPDAVRQRFSKRVGNGQTVVYTGRVVETEVSRWGWLLAQAARLIGAPLPTSRDIGMAAVVTVTEDQANGGQVWTRIYAHCTGFPQVIQSSKRFAGPTGLEEYVGYRVGMALTVSVEGETLAFRSANYFLDIVGRRVVIPTWLTPGHLDVTHKDVGDGRFEFTLEIKHPRLGLLLRQRAVFNDTV